MKRPAPTTKAIWIEWRGPRTKEEKDLFGLSRFDNPSTAHIFVNTRKCKSDIETFKTLWHELVHVFIHFHNKRFGANQEEDMARRVENILWEVLREEFKW